MTTQAIKKRYTQLGSVTALISPTLKLKVSKLRSEYSRLCNIQALQIDEFAYYLKVKKDLDNVRNIAKSLNLEPETCIEEDFKNALDVL